MCDSHLCDLSNAGGVDESNCLNSIEKYDPKSGLWTPFSSLPRMMCGSGMQVLDSVPLSLALPSRKRKALYVDAGLGVSGLITGPQGIVPGVDALNLEADETDITDDSDDDNYGDGGYQRNEEVMEYDGRPGSFAAHSSADD